MAKHDLRIDVLGVGFSISHDEDPAYMEGLLSDYLRAIENTQRKTGVSDPLRTAILAGLLLYEENAKLRTQQSTSEGVLRAMQAEKITGDLIDRLDKLLVTIDREENEEMRNMKDRADLGGVFKLSCEIKHFAWGSPVWIPQLLGQPVDAQKPEAEMWMGVHPGGPSKAPDGESLADVLAGNRRFYLGDELETSGGGLPYLFKLLAAEKPLSIQAHPSLAQAKAGFDRENAALIPLSSPERNYKDANHKPEILCALTLFRAMCGFRPLSEIRNLLDILSCPALAPVRAALSRTDEEAAYRGFLEALFGLSTEERQKLTVFVRQEALATEARSPDWAREWQMLSAFAALFPGDPAIVSPLYLNVLDLAPGEAIFLPPGILHAYVHGFGVELMANSDNVLRGGLTPKHVDSAELLSVLRLAPFKPPVWLPNGQDYPSLCREFKLSVAHGTGAAAPLTQEGPVIIVVTDGALTLNFADGREALLLGKGESAFIAAGEDRTALSLSGEYTFYAASPNPHCTLA